MASDTKWLRLPVVSLGAEYLVMGHLMRRNILAYKAPPNNEGYDIIAIHPDPKHQSRRGKKSQIGIQVKSRFATDAQRGVPDNENSRDAFDYLIAVFLNIGRFGGGKDGSDGYREPEFYSIPAEIVWQHHRIDRGWQKAIFKGIADLESLRDEAGFELIAKDLGIAPVRRDQVVQEDVSQQR